MDRLTEIEARLADPDVRFLVEGGCGGQGEYEDCHDLSLEVEFMAADLAALVEVVKAVRSAIDRADPPGQMKAGTPSVSVAVLRAALNILEGDR